MTTTTAAPWHSASYERFVQETLPELLASRLPLAGYGAERTPEGATTITVSVGAVGEELQAVYEGLPAPDAEGIVNFSGRRLVVVPAADDDDPAIARLACVGEQLLDYLGQRLGQAPEGLQWTEPLLRSWLPLDTWLQGFFTESPTVQPLEDRNWLARQAHLRRLRLPGTHRHLLPTALGRLCPFEAPEGPNLGKVQHLAVGATIRDGRLLAADDTEHGALGLTASMVPCLEHDDPVRLLFGVNMMRQWLPPAHPEPACVQTGNEPAAPDFWCGCNLLTAYMSLGAYTFEDALVLSQSAAARLGDLTVGDKLSNRHGAKGTLSAIWPDEQMPRLPDGTPVELVMSFLGLHTRLNFGQVREAVLGRLARATGREAVVPPFAAPTDEQLAAQLAAAGLPTEGMERLTWQGETLPEPTTVGWVYWGLTYHRAGEKLHGAGLTGQAQRQGELEYYALRDAGAYENVLDTFTTRAWAWAEAEGGAQGGDVCLTAPQGVAPAFARLASRLAAGGVAARVEDGRLRLGFCTPPEPSLHLAAGVAHPWLAERELQVLGLPDEGPDAQALVEANGRLARLLQTEAPPSLLRPARGQLAAAVREYAEELVRPADLRPGARLGFSGRAVLAPAVDLDLQQVGVPEELLWTIFGPLVATRLGDPAAVTARSATAAQCLETLLAESWVLVNRAPSAMPTSLLAFRPVRHCEPVLRLHPLACALLNADFDGDQAAILLPLSAEAQREAGERLSVAGHLRRDPALLRWLTPPQEMIWGLARLSLSEEGRGRVEAALGRALPEEGLLTRAGLRRALEQVLADEGVEVVLQRAEGLMGLGFAAAVCGASLHPFVGTLLQRPAPPGGDGRGDEHYGAEVADWLAALTDYGSPVIGPQLLAVKSGARGSISSLQRLCGPIGATPGLKDYASSLRQLPLRVVPGVAAAAEQSSQGLTIAGGMAGGLTPAELFAHAAGDRESLSRTLEESTRIGYLLRESSLPEDFSVLSRALRSDSPGRVFARAAAAEESDPLETLDGRLFVGLPPR